MAYDDTSLYTCIHIGLILYFHSEKDNPLRVRHCIENLRKWEQNLLHTGRKEGNGFTGCWKTPICGVPLILRRCSVHSSTPHFSGFRAPCIWAFLISLGKASSSTGSLDLTHSAASGSAWKREQRSAAQGQSWSSFALQAIGSKGWLWLGHLL